jgi:hypothetical protein
MRLHEHIETQRTHPFTLALQQVGGSFRINISSPIIRSPETVTIFLSNLDGLLRIVSIETALGDANEKKVATVRDAHGMSVVAKIAMTFFIVNVCNPEQFEDLWFQPQHSGSA